MEKKHLASFSKIAFVFHLCKGALVSHYNRRLEKKEGGQKCILTEEQITLLIDFVHDKFLSENPVTNDCMLSGQILRHSFKIWLKKCIFPILIDPRPLSFDIGTITIKRYPMTSQGYQWQKTNWGVISDTEKAK